MSQETETVSGHTVAVTDKIAVPVIDKSGTQVGSVDVDPADFGGKINRQLLHEVVLMYLANQRAGTHSTLRRGQVAGSTKKLFRQKGTGNARVGPKRTNKRRGGGTAKGPKPRDYEYHLPKKAVRAATRMAILSKLRDGSALVIEDFGFTTPKTKEMAQLLKTIKVVDRRKHPAAEGQETETERTISLLDTTILIGTAGIDQNVYKSGRNIEGVKVRPAEDFNAYEILRQKRLVLTRAALNWLVAKKETKETVAAK